MTKYHDSGVDLGGASITKTLITELIKSTFDDRVRSKGHEFGGVVLSPGDDHALVASMDGVGTKIKVAVLARIHSTIGIDLVNHCVNDIAVMGGTPLFFMDYIACGKGADAIVPEILGGLTAACIEHSMILLGGETAQMPDFYTDGEYDLVGTIVGSMRLGAEYPKEGIRHGDHIFGFASNGLHTNGYSLARRIVFETIGATVDAYDSELGTTWGEELLRPHRSYFSLIRRLIDSGIPKGFAHITGGGIPGNLDRILPPQTRAIVRTSSIPTPPPIFSILQLAGEVSIEEMFNVFNMGVGLVAIIDPKDASHMAALTDDEAFPIGEIVTSQGPPHVQLIFE